MPNQISRHRRFIFLTLIVWLCAMWGGLHGHLCFDGQESPVSVHMDLLDGHPDHLHDDEVHLDTDTELVESILKLTKSELPFLIIALVCALMLYGVRQPFTRAAHRITATSIFFLHPPLRAPPSFSS